MVYNIYIVQHVHIFMIYYGKHAIITTTKGGVNTLILCATEILLIHKIIDIPITNKDGIVEKVLSHEIVDM